MTQALTSLASFKSWQNLPATNVVDDDLIDSLITDASGHILTYLDRPTLFLHTFADYYNGNGTPTQMLRQWPVIAVNSVTDTGTAVVAAVQPNTGYFIDPWDGFLPGRMGVLSYIGGSTQGASSCYGGAYFSRGVKNIYVNYDAGYAVQDESGTIGASPYQITAAQPQGPWAQDDGVTINGVTATAITNGTPTTGQYKVEGGVYSFAAADTGKTVALSYSYVPLPVAQACNTLVGELYTYRGHIGQKSHSFQGQVTTSFDNSIMTDAIMRKLQPFKRMVPL